MLPSCPRKEAAGGVCSSGAGDCCAADEGADCLPALPTLGVGGFGVTFCTHCSSQSKAGGHMSYRQSLPRSCLHGVLDARACATHQVPVLHPHTQRMIAQLRRTGSRWHCGGGSKSDQADWHPMRAGKRLGLFRRQLYAAGTGQVGCRAGHPLAVAQHSDRGRGVLIDVCWHPLRLVRCLHDTLQPGLRLQGVHTPCQTCREAEQLLSWSASIPNSARL